MKKLRYSLFNKILLHLLLFIAGLAILISSCYIIKYFSKYSLNSSFTETIAFEERYSKYLERVAVYIQYKESGFQSEILSSSISSDPPDNFYYIDNTQNDQRAFEFYNKKLNLDKTNFVYYVKNLTTEKEYFSPNLIHPNASLDEIDTTRKNYCDTLKENPAYFILDTRNQVYSTNVSQWGYITTSNVDWIVQCIKGNIYASNDLIKSREEKASTTIGQLSNPLSQTGKNEFLVYTSILPEFPNTNDDFYDIYKDYLTMNHQFQLSAITFPIAVLLFLFLFLLTIAVTGHSSKAEGIKLLSCDRIYTEIAGILSVYLFFFILSFRRHIYLALNLEHYITNSIVSTSLKYTILYPFVAFCFFSLIRRLKAHTFWTNMLIYKTFKKIKTALVRFIENRDVTYSAALYFGIFIFLQILAVLLLSSNFTIGILILTGSILFGGVILFRTASDLNIVVKETKKIAEGDLKHQISYTALSGPNKTLGQYINHIGDGLSSAVEEQLKSERLKTELITNVSHDIKTPLTSIINYVDLLQKENLQNPVAERYLEILVTKTLRLKNLIEDLVEASKASSGSITLNLEKLNIVELVRQSAGEFDDRFQERNLEVVISIQEEPIFILADGRSTFRIIENVFSNVNKYALQGTRVYIDITKQTIQDAFPLKETVSVSVKNISAHKLNIPSDELLERFARGDLARSSEGSGLGLSIANSLSDLQNAKFHIVLDGDLFKAVLTFDTIHESYPSPSNGSNPSTVDKK